MKILHMSYAYIGAYHDPHAWLNRIGFFTGILEGMATQMEVVAVYNISFTGEIEKNGVKYLFPEFRPMALRLPFGFNRYIRSLNPDIIIIQGLSPWQVALLGRMTRSAKILVQHRAEKPFRGIRKFLQKQADKYIHAYFFSSAALAEDWISSGQIRNADKVFEVLGMSSTFSPVEKKLALSRTGVRSDLVFLWVGDLNANKNPTMALDAFAEFVKDHPSSLLVMVYQTNGLEETLRSRIKGLEGNIKLVGKVAHENMTDWYNSSDFILSTSYYESGGLSVCEGMSCGCIPIVTDIPSFRMMTDRGRVGLLFRAGNKESLLAALVESVSWDRASKRESVLAYFKSNLSFDANVARILEVVNSVK